MDICHSGSVHSEWAQHKICSCGCIFKDFPLFLEKVNIVKLHFWVSFGVFETLKQNL